MPSSLDKAKIFVNNLSTSDLEHLKSYIQTRQLKNPHLAPRCMLLELPAELRNRIWSFTISLLPTQVAYAADATLPPSICVTSNSYDVEERCKQPAISRTCRALRAETLPIFYGANKWKITSVSFARAIACHIKLFKEVEVGHCWVSNGKRWSLPEEGEEERVAEMKTLGFAEGVLKIAGIDPFDEFGSLQSTLFDV